MFNMEQLIFASFAILQTLITAIVVTLSDTK